MSKYLLYTMKNRDFLYPHEKCLCVPTTNPPLSLNFTKNLRSRLYSVRTSRETDFRKLKITLVTMTCHSQHPQFPSLSPHVLLQFPIRVSLSQVRRLNAAVAICRRYRLSEDIALSMYTLMILKRSDRFAIRWA